MNTNVSIIILNWNGWEDTIECLESLYQTNYPNFDVIIVDNGSEDNSIKQIKDYCSGKLPIESKFFTYKGNNKPIKTFEYFENTLNLFKQEKTKFKQLNSKKKLIIIKNFENKGYADGNNIGIKFICEYLNSKYLLILNNDIVVDPNFLDELITVAQKDRNIGILGPINLFYNKHNEIHSNGAKLNFWTGSWQAINSGNFVLKQIKEPLEVDFVIGSAIMVKRDVIDKIGGFYSQYFAHWEETDYCIRAKNNGFRVISVPSSKIWHKVSSSISYANPIRIYLILRNNIIFMRRNAKLRHFPSFIIFYLFIKVPSFLYWGYRGNSKQKLNLIRMSLKAIIDGFTLKINE